jgi:ubiquinone biosynthesis protein Coq4
MMASPRFQSSPKEYLRETKHPARMALAASVQKGFDSLPWGMMAQARSKRLLGVAWSLAMSQSQERESLGL